MLVAMITFLVYTWSGQVHSFPVLCTRGLDSHILSLSWCVHGLDRYILLLSGCARGLDRHILLLSWCTRGLDR